MGDRKVTKFSHEELEDADKYANDVAAGSKRRNESPESVRAGERVGAMLAGDRAATRQGANEKEAFNVGDAFYMAAESRRKRLDQEDAKKSMQNFEGMYEAAPGKYAKGGAVTNFRDDHAGHHDMKRGGSVRGSCCAVRGKTKGRMV